MAKVELTINQMDVVGRMLLFLFIYLPIRRPNPLPTRTK
jgi:hypothetical protein